MELDGGFHINKGFLIGVALSYYYAIDADGIGNIAVEMLFYYYFYRLHLSDTWSFLENKTMLGINRSTGQVSVLPFWLIQIIKHLWPEPPSQARFALSGRSSDSTGQLVADDRPPGPARALAPAWAGVPRGLASIALAASRAGKPGTEAARLDGLASFALLQLVPDAPELLQRHFQALDDLPAPGPPGRAAWRSPPWLSP